MMPRTRTTEYVIACASFVAAVIFAFTSLLISDTHECAAGNCSVVAQFLLLTASIFGIDYKLNKYGTAKETKTNAQGNQK